MAATTLAPQPSALAAGPWAIAAHDFPRGGTLDEQLRMLLRARADGVWAPFLNQPIEVPAFRSRLAAAVGCSGYPQLLLRLGYGHEVRPTPRRPVYDVVLP